MTTEAPEREVRAACVVIQTPTEDLWVKRNDDTRAWQAGPGGKIEEGETPAEAAARKAYEEVSLKLRPEKLIPVKVLRLPRKKHPGEVLVLHVFRAEFFERPGAVPSIQGVNGKPGEVRKVKWERGGRWPGEITSDSAAVVLSFTSPCRNIDEIARRREAVEVIDGVAHVLELRRELMLACVKDKVTYAVSPAEERLHSKMHELVSAQLLAVAQDMRSAEERSSSTRRPWQHLVFEKARPLCDLPRHLADSTPEALDSVIDQLSIALGALRSMP